MSESAANGHHLRVIATPEALFEWAGREVALSDWLVVAQERISAFAEVTGDDQWIHIDPARAARESPFGTTIAHGYLTLALLPTLFKSCLRIDNVRAAINYGLDRVRFPAPVRAGQRVRASLRLERVVPIDGGIQAHWAATIEIENATKPACVAQLLVRYYGTAKRAASRNAAADTGKR